MLQDDMHGVSPSAPSLLTQKQLAERLAVTARTVRRWHQQETIPHIKRAKRPRYEWDQVVAYLTLHYGVGYVKERLASAEEQARKARPQPNQN